ERNSTQLEQRLGTAIFHVDADGERSGQGSSEHSLITSVVAGVVGSPARKIGRRAAPIRGVEPRRTARGVPCIGTLRGRRRCQNGQCGKRTNMSQYVAPNQLHGRLPSAGSRGSLQRDPLANSSPGVNAKV